MTSPGAVYEEVGMSLATASGTVASLSEKMFNVGNNLHGSLPSSPKERPISAAKR
ncbi:MAG: hypothetical protein ACLQVY_14750 [Limisphaerales bacterium]